MAKCKDCKHLDMTQKTSVGYVCTNVERRRYLYCGRYRNLSHLKAPHTKACKSGFEPREKEGE